MNRSTEDMDGLEETEQNGTPVSSPEVPNSNLFCFEPKQYSTKKEKLARSGSKTPGIDYAPPRPPAKSAPPVSRIFSRRETVGPVSVSFRAPPSLASPLYSVQIKKSYFEQMFVNHTKIGQGSFGEVFKATSKDDEQEYAIKKAHMNSLSSGRRARVYDEVRKHEMLPPHPNIVKFYLAWEEEHILYIKLELCRESLNQYTFKHHDIGEVDVWTIFADLLFGVRHLHSHNMVHMDIKPENIFIAFNGVCKLGDLGLVIHNCKPNSHAEEGDGRYLAVEAINGNPGKPSDIFSLGVTILELATDLDVPLVGDLWQNLRKGILPTELLSDKSRSELLQNVIEWMLLHDYIQRPTVENLLEHPELYLKFEEREKMYNFPEKIKMKVDMPSLVDLAKKRVKIRPDEKEEEVVEGAVGGAPEEDMLDLSASNESRGSDEVDGLIPTCKEVLTMALLPQEPDTFDFRHARSEPLRRSHTALGSPESLQSPVRQVKIPRFTRQGRVTQEELAGFVNDFEVNGNGEGDKICAPRNLMTLFDASDKYAEDDDDVMIGGYDQDETPEAASSDLQPIDNGDEEESEMAVDEFSLNGDQSSSKRRKDQTQGKKQSSL